MNKIKLSVYNVQKRIYKKKTTHAAVVNIIIAIKGTIFFKNF